MIERVQTKIHQIAQQADNAVGYSVSGVLGSAPVWLDALTGWLELIAVLIAIIVGISTYQLNRIKMKNIKGSKVSKDAKK